MSKNCGKVNKKTWNNHKPYSDTRLYSIWGNMKQRCSNKNNTHYDFYGGKGIEVCDEWLEFKHFEKWALENGYKENLTIDRIKGKENYCKENCRWVTRKEQSNNIKSNVKVEFNGEELNLNQWAEKFNINRNTLYKRYYKGDRNEILFRKIDKNKSCYFEEKININYEEKTLLEWAEETDISKNTLYTWKRRGVLKEKILKELRK